MMFFVFKNRLIMSVLSCILFRLVLSSRFFIRCVVFCKTLKLKVFVFFLIEWVVRKMVFNCSVFGVFGCKISKCCFMLVNSSFVLLKNV